MARQGWRPPRRAGASAGLFDMHAEVPQGRGGEPSATRPRSVAAHDARLHVGRDPRRGGGAAHPEEQRAGVAGRKVRGWLPRGHQHQEQRAAQEGAGDAGVSARHVITSAQLRVKMLFK